MNENLCLLSTTRSFKTVYSIKLQFHKGMKPSLALGQKAAECQKAVYG